jgi:Mitochondrial mRNA-processing protein COX24, C-terminal
MLRRHHGRPRLPARHKRPGEGDREARVGSVIKKRRKKMRKHKHKKMLKKTRWQRRAS